MIPLRTLQRTTPAISTRSVCLLAHRSSPALRAFLSSSAITRNKPNNAEEIEKLNELIKVKLAEIEEAEKKRIVQESKPKISDFKRPIYLTLVIASTSYLALHWAWWYLQFDEREKELQGTLQEKEQELALALESQSRQIQSQSNPGWWKIPHW